MIEAIKADFEGNKKEKEKNEKICNEIDEFLLSLNPPNDFRGDSSVLIEMDRSFEKLCSSMEEAGIHEPKKLTTFEFYSRLDYFQEKNKKK